jgi:hypothetical protein
MAHDVGIDPMRLRSVSRQANRDQSSRGNVGPSGIRTGAQRFGDLDPLDIAITERVPARSRS